MSINNNGTNTGYFLTKCLILQSDVFMYVFDSTKQYKLQFGSLRKSQEVRAQPFKLNLKIYNVEMSNK